MRISHGVAFFVPIIGVWMGLGYNAHTGFRVPASDLANTFSWMLMDPVVLMFFGSMTISDCLGKYHITDRVSNFVFNRLSKKPNFILITIMLLNLFAAAFFSNIASTTLLLTLVIPIIRTLDPDDPFIRALLFGLAWSGNIGGMMTPIATAVNILALKNIQTTGITLTFLRWMYFAVPPCIITCILFWVYLILQFPSQRNSITVVVDSQHFSSWSLKHTYVVIITVLTIVLWTLEEQLPFLGHVGITSLIPIAIYFGLDLMSIKDFQNLKWQTLFFNGGWLMFRSSHEIKWFVGFHYSKW